jgi:translation initiation factor IF-1
MSKEDYIQMQGTVIEVCPNALFRVKLENDHIVLAHLAGKMRIHNINIHLLDQVTVDVSSYDLTKARIVYRQKRVRNQPAG